MAEGSPTGRFLVLLAIVAGATAIGSIVGGEIGRLVGVSKGHGGDQILFDRLGGGAVGAIVLSLAVGLGLAPRFGHRRLVGAAAAAVCLAGLLFLFTGPIRV